MKALLSVAATAAMLCSGSAWAQKKAVNSANNYIVSGELDRAKTEIEAAVVNDATKDDPRAWFVRGEVYRVMQEKPEYATQKPYREAARSFMRAAELGSKDAGIGDRLLSTAIYYYNDGLAAFNAQNYTEAYDMFGWPVKIQSMNGGATFRGNRMFDTVAGRSQVLQGFSALRAEKYAEASAAFEAARANPAAAGPDVYLALVEAYEKQNMGDKSAAIVAEGRQKYPDNKGIQAAELNQMMKSGEMDKIISKLEAAVAAEPNNALYQYNLAYAYMNMGTATKRPSNYRDLIEKSEAAFRKAVSLDPQNVDYIYNLGVLFYNQAVTYTEEMNKIPGNTDGELRRYEAIKTQRNALFTKAQEPFESAFEMLYPRRTSLNADEEGMYSSVTTGLAKIYGALELNEKLSALQTKTK